MIKDALYWELKGERVHCFLCPNHCHIKEGHIGACGVREVQRDVESNNLKLVTINYGEITSFALDPIEKKPLYHFEPGKVVLSIGSFGCNFKCSFCQNYSISQYKADSTYISPSDLVEILKKTDSEVQNNIGIAFTYNEPSIWYEYVYDCATMIKEKLPNKKIVLVSNGYITKDPLINLLPYVDAMNIDLKGDETFYKQLCKGGLEHVLETVKLAHNFGVHIEITTLLINKENTDNETVQLLGDFLHNLDRKIPLHISRYFPNFKLDNPPTTLDEMKVAYSYLRDKLDFVFVGNVSESERKYITTVD
ncbi:MAG: radical superfamily protein [Bacillales bacterium]|jgi:pyruvate formate lyase activating enzyme|nr:radical superfamily protein [Bacillales bacterium]